MSEPQSSQGPPEPNRYGHAYLPKAMGGLRSPEGYAICSLCGCRENTDASATECPNRLPPITR